MSDLLLTLKRNLNKILSDFGNAYENLPDDMDDLSAQKLSILFESTIDEIIAKAQKHYEVEIGEIRGELDTLTKKLDDREVDLIQAKKDERDKTLSALRRFTQKIKSDTNGCWLWQGSLYPTGYACFELNGKTTRGHRFAYELFRGSIPRELQLDHLCFNKDCVNPFHLEIVTNQENTQRYYRKNLTHCKQGHPYTFENTYLNTRGHRECKECRRISRVKYNAKYRARLKALTEEE